MEEEFPQNNWSDEATGNTIASYFHLIVAFIEAIGDILIISVILKFRMLWTTRNILIINWMLADFLVMIPVSSKIILYIATDVFSNWAEFCEKCLVLAEIIRDMFILSLLLDFIYNRITINSIKWVSLMVWGLGIGFIICCSALSIDYYSPKPKLPIDLALHTIVLLSFLAKCIMCCNGCNRNFERISFILIVVFVCTYLPMVVLKFTFYFSEFNPDDINFFFYVVLTALPFFNSVIQLSVLISLNSDFKMCFAKFFTWQKNERRRGSIGDHFSGPI